VCLAALSRATHLNLQEVLRRTVDLIEALGPGGLDRCLHCARVVHGQDGVWRLTVGGGGGGGGDEAGGGGGWMELSIEALSGV